MMDELIAPLRGGQVRAPWEGACRKKPWQYRVTAAIPVLGTPEVLDVCIETLRSQTEPPFIVVIDTGSAADELERIESFRAEDVEVHSLRLNGVIHPSDFPAMAMDLAFTLCRTEFIFATHADVFARRRDFLADMVEWCRTVSPVVGYQISPRTHEDWRGMVSHTATMYHMPTMDRIGFGWSQRRLCHMAGIADYRPSRDRQNWPDTELLGNYILRQWGIAPYLIGDERNFERHVDENIDHCRSLTSGRLYSPEYFDRARTWADKAMNEARQRIERWKKSSGSSAPATPVQAS